MSSVHKSSCVSYGFTDKLPGGKGGVMQAVQNWVLRAGAHVRGRTDVPGLWHRHSVWLLQRLPPSGGLREVPCRPGEGGTESGLGPARHTDTQSLTLTRTHSHHIVRMPFFLFFFLSPNVCICLAGLLHYSIVFLCTFMLPWLRHKTMENICWRLN